MDQKKDFSLGLEKVNQEYRKLKDCLNEVAKTENLIENLAGQYGLDAKANTFEEYEILVNSELNEFGKSKKALTFLKGMLILFEAFSGYLAIGLVFHMMNIEEFVGENGAFAVKLFLAILLSFGFIHLAVIQVKKMPPIAIVLIIIFPLVNLAVVYFLGIQIDHKETYLISSFITLTAGSCMLFIARKEFIKEQSIKILNEISIKLKERESSFDSGKKHFLKIYNLNNQDNGFLNEIDNIPDSNILYKELKNFLLNCEDFEEWSYQEIDKIKYRLKNRNLNQKKEDTDS